MCIVNLVLSFDIYSSDKINHQAFSLVLFGPVSPP